MTKDEVLLIKQWDSAGALAKSRKSGILPLVARYRYCSGPIIAAHTEAPVTTFLSLHLAGSALSYHHTCQHSVQALVQNSKH